MTSSRTRATSLSATLAALATVVTLAGPAFAAERTVSDADDLGPGVDLRRARIVDDAAVRVVTRHDDLRPFAGSAGLRVFLDTDRTEAGPEFVFSAGLTDGTDFALVRGGWGDGGARVEGEDCSYRQRLDYAADVSRIRIARSCLGDPDAVRVAIRVDGTTRDGQPRRDWLHGHRTWTRWVARG